MNTFEEFKLSKQLLNAIEDLGFEKPTPIQKKSFPLISSGKDMVGISQTGTGKTLAYLLPLFQNLKFSTQLAPRILVLVPTRELVLQLVNDAESLSKYKSIRVKGVYGGTNINTQKISLAEGADIVVATPGRLYDLALCGSLKLNAIKKLVIDEVDIMLDLGFRFQLTNIFELLPKRRQNIMFSATMTNEVDALIDDFFIAPEKISIAVSGTRLNNISQICYAVKNFYTKANLVKYLLKDKETFSKVLIFISTKKNADRLFAEIEPLFGRETCIIHSNKTQNYRIRSIQQFEEGKKRIIVATDVMARGLDIENITHVISFDTPNFPENYIHRIGRTGRAEKEGKSILLYTEKDQEAKKGIEQLMSYKIPERTFPETVVVSSELLPEERPKKLLDTKNPNRNIKKVERGAAFHEKKAKNKKTNQGGSYLRKKKVYKKPKTRGDKNYNRRKKR
ncbi:MAG: DEAD/DEAH box helicase [Bacteroidia bacterium]|nr:MAG: DEAD/DEAH box helicase [Bacteroidia bacterium]